LAHLCQCVSLRMYHIFPQGRHIYIPLIGIQFYSGFQCLVHSYKTTKLLDFTSILYILFTLC
jgi:hypothetical protein